MQLKAPKIVIIDIMNHTGELRLEATGYQGKSCEEATKFLSEALGNTVSTELKPEYFMQDEEKTTLLRSFCG